MWLRDIYNNAPVDDVVHYSYVTTLMVWLIANDFDIFDDVLKEFENKEDYQVCHGIHLGMRFIEELMDQKFKEHSEVTEDSSKTTYLFDDANKYKEVSKEIFIKVIVEIYESQVGGYKKTD